MKLVEDTPQPKRKYPIGATIFVPIKDPVGNGMLNHPDDVRRVKAGLDHIGLFDRLDDTDQDTPDNPILTHKMDDAIKMFQRDNGLKVDGKLNPGGETERALSTHIAQADPMAVKPKKKPQTKDEPPKPTRKPKNEIGFGGNVSGRIEPKKKKRETESSDEVFNRFRENLKPREGGFIDDPDDDGGPTNKGVSQKLLDTLNKSNPNLDLPEKSQDLSDEQIEYVFRKEFYEKPKLDKLNKVAGKNKTGSTLVEHVFDAGVMSGSKDAAIWLQQSIDETMGTDLREEISEGKRKYDGNIGPKTRSALEEAISNRKIKEISKRFADKRQEHIRKHPDYWKYGDGWESRIKSLRD